MEVVVHRIVHCNNRYGCAQHRSSLPSVGEEVHLDVGVQRSTVGPRRQVYGLKDVDNQLMAHLIVTQLHLGNISAVRAGVCLSLCLGGDIQCLC